MELRFDFAQDDTTTGFRLETFSFYNWGTYNAKIVKLELDRNNALLTGDIGSGKSTVVDAITTLLVPSNRITYNKAAGANAKERSLYSYIVGEYKTTQDEHFGRAKAVSLRDENSFSVLLAKFGNAGYDEHLFLAQFFYINNRQPQRFFVVSKGELGIREDFFNFKDVKALKKRLRAKNHTFVFDTFKEYARVFRSEMGLKSEQALNLFYQTVSLKAIGNLTEFIRVHMLEDFGMEQRIDEICANFAELHHAHNLVLKAKREIALLTPVGKEYQKYQNFYAKKEHFLKLRELLNCYVSFFEKALLESKLKELSLELQKRGTKRKILEEEQAKLENEIVDIKLQLQKNGADRLNTIENEIQNSASVMARLKEANRAYNEIVKSLGFSAVSNEHRFLLTRDALERDFESIEDEKAALQNKITTNSVILQRYKEQQEALEAEIAYLEQNRTNIPKKVSAIRDRMAEALGIETGELPFIGELIRVSDTAWEGAIERVLHNTALSVLVDKRYYEKVSAYADETDLKGKIVYLNVDSAKKADTFPERLPGSLPEKVEIKADSPYFDVLSRLLHERFNIPCVDTLEAFRRYKKALTIHGQYKANLTRHEKDDRFAIDDKSRWVLGWDNAVKLEEFRHKAKVLEEKSSILNRQTEEYTHALLATESKRDRLRDALKFKNFEEIDWYRYSAKIETLEHEREELLKSSDIIQSLQAKLTERTLQAQKRREEINALLLKIGSLENEKEKREAELNRAMLTLENCTLDDQNRQKLDEIKVQLQITLNLNTIQSTQRKMREFLQGEIDKLGKNLDKISQRIITAQSAYQKEFQLEAKELLIEVEASVEYIKRLELLKKENLPKWESRFKRLFKEKSIQDIVMLQSTLEQRADEIKSKIEIINTSLKDIEYSEGTFIELVAVKAKQREIREFKEKLKLITTGAIDENNEYNEEKFLLLKELIERFNGREGRSDIDKKWRKFVSDVRNWFEFSAAEKYIGDGSLKEYYEDSGGKSGGQKEKLAYTVLASSLAYQFGVEPGKIQSRSFRFVMIDEAFGRGSDESTRYALRLFEKLKLQLLVVTPKQKINVIEPFVKSVHFVSNRDGMDSSLVSLSIEAYQKRKQ